MDQHSDNSTQSSEPQPPANEQPSLTEPATLTTRSPALRKRLVQIGWGLVAVVIILAAVWGIFFPKFFNHPTKISVQPTQVLTTLHIASNVTFGTVTVNGVLQSGPPPLNLSMQTQPPYTVIINAPPFRQAYCLVGGPRDATRPPDTGGGCTEGFGVSQPGENQGPSLFLDVTFTLNDLPQDQQNAITALLPQVATVSQKTSVPAQSYIATSIAAAGDIKTQRASGTLQATATFAPSAQFNQPDPFHYCQNLLCYNSTPIEVASNGGNSWAVDVPMALSWRFTNAAGAVVGKVSLPFTDLVRIYLAYDQTQGWHVVSPNGAGSIADLIQQLYCTTGVEMLQVETARFLTSEGWAATPLTSKGVEGCLLDLQQNNLEKGHFLWRFGVIMAADDTAHATLPALPVAPPEELAAVSG